MLSSRFEQALGDAARLHRDQRRKTGAVPYVAHLLAVTAMVLEDNGSEDEAIAALFHDAIEDQGGSATMDAIRADYGDAVARIVDGCTDAVGAPGSARGASKPPWRARKQAHIAKLDDPDGDLPPGVFRVTGADKLHNARSLLAEVRARGDAAWSAFNAGPEDQLWYYRSMAALVSRRHPGPLADELGRVVEDLAGAAAR
ncbi:MAG: HD domain-containing protein [Acidimicrobiales bacterium]